MPGCGKSSVGRRVARRTGRRFVDIDAEIERTAGRPIPEIFADQGEGGFRAIEAAVLADVLSAGEASVVATGGGAVLRDANRSAMREHGIVVWLRATPETLAERVGDGRTRPLLAGDPVGNLRRLYEERAASYAAAAHVVVDVDRTPFEKVADRVIQSIAQAQEVTR
jgi:shikimate kinase